MRLDLHIERLVVRGRPMTGREQARLAEAVQVELARRMDPTAADQGPRGRPPAARSRHDALAAHIARSIHDALPSSALPSSPRPRPGGPR